MAHLLDIFQGKSETTLVPQIVFLAPLVLNVVTRHFIDGVVGQMHVQIVQIVLIWRPVLTCRQTAQTFLVEQNSERVDSTKQDVDSQIKLQPVYQEWFVKVPLDNVVLIRVEIFKTAREEDASALRRSFRLGNESLAIRLSALFCLVTELLFKFAELCWQEPCLWKEFIVIWVNILHALQVPRQVVLPRQRVHSREMIDSLIWFHAVEFVDLDGAIGPEYVPFVIWVRVIWHVGCSRQAHFEHRSRHISHNVILGL